MQLLRCDKPYNLDEVRKAKGKPRIAREDSRTTLYELTIRVPKDYRVYLEGKTKFTRRVFALNRRELQNEVRAFEDEKNDELEKAIAEYKLALESSERKALSLPVGEDGYCTSTLTEYAERYVEVRSHGSVSPETIKNELNYLRYINATIGDKMVCKVTSDDVEGRLIAIPRLSRQWGQERIKQLEENRKTATWAKKKKTLVTPLKEPPIAGSDTRRRKCSSSCGRCTTTPSRRSRCPRTRPMHASSAGCSSRASRLSTR